MLREGTAIGAITVSRGSADRSPTKQIALLETFADQAVIAIENVRLFNELRARTAELTRSVEELTALGEVSRAVSSTLDLETVLEHDRHSRQSSSPGRTACSIYEYDEATRGVPAAREPTHDPTSGGSLDASRAPRRSRKGQGLTGRAAERREPVQIPDIAVEGAYAEPHADIAAPARAIARCSACRCCARTRSSAS